MIVRTRSQYPGTQAIPPTAGAPLWVWPLLAALAVLVPLARSLGAPLGEPAADDFDFLRHAMGGWSPLDGGGGHFYWRPLARQGYFGLAAPWMIAAPAAVAALHATLLALSAWLAARTLTRWLTPPAAAAAACFAVLSEPARMLIAWPSSMQDLGAILFVALALHEASRARPATALVALAAGLLCKEQAIVAAPFLPLVAPRGRARLGLGALVVVGAWGLAYRWVVSHAGLALGREEIADSALHTTPWLERIAWSLGHLLRDAWAPAALAPAWRAWAFGGAALLAGAALTFAAASAAARTRLRATIRPLALGLAFWLAAAILLAEVHPVWWPYRGVFAMAGLGVACAAIAWAAHPRLLVALVALRVATTLASPAPPSGLVFASELGGEFGFSKLVQLQRLAAETRATLRARFPELPRGAVVGLHHLPRGSAYAYAGDKALQVWYADTTLRWVSSEARSTAAPPVTVLQYQPHAQPALAHVAPAAMDALDAASAAQRANDCPRALAALARADSLQDDPNARVFLATLAAKSAVCLYAGLDIAGAEHAAERAFALWPDNSDSRFILARIRMNSGRPDEAERLLVAHLAAYPGDAEASALLAEARRAGGH